jgi:hypothetical protein
MADKVPPGDAPFDLEKLKQLVEMMESHGLTEVHLRRGDEQWRLRRGPESHPRGPTAVRGSHANGTAARSPGKPEPRRQLLARPQRRLAWS